MAETTVYRGFPWHPLLAVECHGIPRTSIEDHPIATEHHGFRGVPWVRKTMEIAVEISTAIAVAFTTEFHSMCHGFLRTSMVFRSLRGTIIFPWSSVENSMEFHGTPWDSMELTLHRMKIYTFHQIKYYVPSVCELRNRLPVAGLVEHTPRSSRRIARWQVLRAMSANDLTKPKAPGSALLTASHSTI